MPNNESVIEPDIKRNIEIDNTFNYHVWRNAYCKQPPKLQICFEYKLFSNMANELV